MAVLEFTRSTDGSHVDPRKLRGSDRRKGRVRHEKTRRGRRDKKTRKRNENGKNAERTRGKEGPLRERTSTPSTHTITHSHHRHGNIWVTRSEHIEYTL